LTSPLGYISNEIEIEDKESGGAIG